MHNKMIWYITGQFLVAGLVLLWQATSADKSSIGGLRHQEGAIHSEEDSQQALARRILQGILQRKSALAANFSADGVEFVPPCTTHDGLVMESTSSLLVATALTKADNNTLQKHSLWHFFNALFAVPSRGFIPRFSYPVEGQAFTNRTEDFYVGSSRIPNWPIFQSMPHSPHKNSPCLRNETRCWVGSGRVSSIPFHGTVLLELLLQLQRRRDDDSVGVTQSELWHLCKYWKRIFEYHDWIHTNVMRGCNNQTKLPCYNILHPWESLLDASTSPTWHVAMKPTMARMMATNWTPQVAIPPQVKESYGFNETIYKSMLYLNECLVTQIAIMDDHQYPYQFDRDALSNENRLLEACQFAMLDVGYASALAQADLDLLTVAIWLSAQDGVSKLTSSSSWTTRMSRLKVWVKQNEYVLDMLWHPQEQSFQSHYALPYANTTEFPFPQMRYIRAPSANNLMVFWKEWNAHPFGLPLRATHTDILGGTLDQRLQEMAMQLLRHNGKDSFDCGDSYPIWAGGCSDTSSSSHIDPRWNYFIGLGLSRNKDAFSPFGQYLTNATIQLICSGRNSTAKDNAPIWSNCAWNLTRFQEAFQAVSTHTEGSFHLDECGLTSTSTAAILYHLLLDDFDFTSESPIPPIRNSWVITLITVELMIAFAVGLTCVLLSLNIVFRENRIEDMEESAIFRGDIASYDPLMQEVGNNTRDEEDIVTH